MALWEIRLANQAPIRVEVDDSRNLSEEYHAFQASQRRPFWAFWRQTNPYWKVTDLVTLHYDIVAGVMPKRVKEARQPIGFNMGVE